MVSFYAWVFFFLFVVIALVWQAKRSRHVEEISEDVASQALPTIGSIAERQHTLRFGRPPTNTPGPPGTSVWYPPTKKKRHRHA
jgi:hypothetical protein